MTDDLAFTPATELVAGYRDRTLSPVDVTGALLDRIETLNPALNAYRLIDREGALAASRASQARWAKGAPQGRVDGVPVSIKDLVLTRGLSTLRGSRTVDPAGDWTEDAPAVARLRAEGAVILGKTATCEFGWKGVTDSPLTGITRNPWNLERTPGGSSGGAAAAVAAGLGPLAIGSDGGGSIRIPAGFTGTFGIKASFGRVASYPPSPFGTLSHVGPMTRTVADAALMLSVIAGSDPTDWLSLPDAGTDWRDGIEGGVAGLRVAFSADLGYARVAPDVARRVAAAAALFEDLGAVVEAVDPDIADPLECFRVHWYAGAANLLRDADDARRRLIEPGLIEIADTGAGYSGLDLTAAANFRADFAVRLGRFHERYDLLLTPALPLTAFTAGLEVPEGSGLGRWFEWSPFSLPFNLTGQPAASVPCGFGDDGLPVGLQIVGRRHDDGLVLRAARALETARPWAARRPPIAATT